MVSRLIQMEVDGIDKVYGVALFGESEGVGAGSAADVENYGGWGGKVAREDGLGAELFEFAVWAREAVGFFRFCVMSLDFFRYEWIGHWGLSTAIRALPKSSMGEAMPIVAWEQE